MPEPLDYIREGAEIYRRSFATIRAEANLTRFKGLEEKVAVRIIHACGMVEIADDIDMSADFAEKARGALLAGAPILCDSKMVAQGITRSRLPADNTIICTLDDPRTPDLARAAGNTRSAGAMALWEPHLAGSLVAIGNAPTSLFRLLEMIAEGAAAPAAVIGTPVGFVGAAESKALLAAEGCVPFLIVRGRKGGSAMAVAAINALSSEIE
ncbi:MAG: precorrin-8X methylmutase [Rhodomicrobium sp.]